MSLSAQRNSKKAKRMCLDKIRFADKWDALTSLNCYAKHRGRHGRPDSLRIYHCPICNGWHQTKGDA